MVHILTKKGRASHTLFFYGCDVKDEQLYNANWSWKRLDGVNETIPVSHIPTNTDLFMMHQKYSHILKISFKFF